MSASGASTVWGIFNSNGDLQVVQGFSTRKEAMARADEIAAKLKLTGKLIVKKL